VLEGTGELTTGALHRHMAGLDVQRHCGREGGKGGREGRREGG
jgi:hypothetical protein